MLYDTADGGDVLRAARTVLMGQSRAEAMDGQNSGTRTVTDRAKRYRSWAAGCVLACLDWSWRLADRLAKPAWLNAGLDLLPQHSTATATVRGCFEFALIRPDVEVDLDLWRYHHAVADVYSNRAAHTFLHHSKQATSTTHEAVDRWRQALCLDVPDVIFEEHRQFVRQ